MRKCIIWGMGNEYENLLNPILFESYKGNISVEAVVSNRKSKYCSKRDGYNIIHKSRLPEFEYDYIIVSSEKNFDDICAEAVDEFGAPRTHVIPGSVFHLPLFDLDLYKNLIENPVTILSDDCWGAGVQQAETSVY